MYMACTSFTRSWMYKVRLSPFNCRKRAVTSASSSILTRLLDPNITWISWKTFSHNFKHTCFSEGNKFDVFLEFGNMAVKGKTCKANSRKQTCLSAVHFAHRRTRKWYSATLIFGAAHFCVVNITLCYAESTTGITHIAERGEHEMDKLRFILTREAARKSWNCGHRVLPDRECRVVH